MAGFIDKIKGDVSVNYAEIAGYSDEELGKIERLYDVELKGDLRDFLSEIGRCADGLLGDDPFIMYRPTWGVLTQISTPHILFELMKGTPDAEILKQKPFLFAIEAETQYYFVLTASEDYDTVYHYDENEEVLRKTDETFLTYIRKTVEYSGRNEVLCRGELLNVRGAQPLTTVSSGFLQNIKGDATVDYNNVSGYSPIELGIIEELYDFKLKGKIGDFLYEMGRCSGGILGDEIVFYKNWSVREQIRFQYPHFFELLQESPQIDMIDEGPIVFALDGEERYYFVLTNSSNPEQVYVYETQTQEATKTEWTFTEYMRDCVTHHSRTDAPLFRGELVNV